MKKSLLTISLFTLGLTVSVSANAALEKGDFLIRAGAVMVAPDESSSGVKAGSADLGGNVSVDNNTQLGINFAYMVMDHWAVELLAATPFSHDVSLGGAPAGLDTLNGGLGNIKHLPPTLSVLYYPMAMSSKFQPYAGIGINYTMFFDESIDSSAEAKGFSNLNLDNSWGLAGQIGMDYFITDNITLNAQVRYIDIDTKATVDLSGVGALDVDVDIDPWVYMVGIGYKF
ncbi:OmpW/AlkL family protein [Vibrio casei]|uniref:Outer membrane protein OmpW n=1 Tax=Vibrio casei TaxID=673372 RepID=A0A368LQ51_9VIBR|nr:OmpW family outer membrane protein [Vibrio casei]RCS73945.1 outer membrane protein OmpW [Vibrio casei]SJN32083.1 Outer membrane protein W precursor [Vibrio casei]